MGQVDECREEDIPAVADLHNRLFFRRADASSEGLRAYYRDIFFRNPWYEEKLPSLVYRVGGKVMGFLGCIPRRMQINGQPVRVATLHRLMVAPDADSPVAALRLVKDLLAGPQDLTLTDGANDNGRKILEFSGASLVLLYSMKWLRALRPCAFAVEMLSKRSRGVAALAVAARPAGRLADRILCRSNGNPFGLTRPATKEVEVRGDLMLRGLEEFSRRHALRPTYDLQSVEWLLNRLRANKHRGEFGGVGIFREDDQFIGLCLYYLNAARVAEIMLLAARHDSRDAVLRHVMYQTWQRGGIGLIGRLEPRFLQSFSEHDCLIKGGDWALVHAKDPELINIINRGDAFISPLEGELWLRSPTDRF